MDRKLSNRQKARLALQAHLMQEAFPRDDVSMRALDAGTEYGHTGRQIRGIYPHARLTGVEIHEPTLLECAEDNQGMPSPTYDSLIHRDVLEFLKEQEGPYYDLIVCAELIEHLPKEKGHDLLRLLAHATRGLAIVTSPVGFQEQGELFGNPHQKHLSGWTPEELEEAGWSTYSVTTRPYSLGVYFLDRTGRVTK